MSTPPGLSQGGVCLVNICLYLLPVSLVYDFPTHDAPGIGQAVACGNQITLDAVHAFTHDNLYRAGTLAENHYVNSLPVLHSHFYFLGIHSPQVQSVVSNRLPKTRSSTVAIMRKRGGVNRKPERHTSVSFHRNRPFVLPCTFEAMRSKPGMSLSSTIGKRPVRSVAIVPLAVRIPHSCSIAGFLKALETFMPEGFGHERSIACSPLRNHDAA